MPHALGNNGNPLHFKSMVHFTIALILNFYRVGKISLVSVNGTPQWQFNGKNLSDDSQLHDFTALKALQIGSVSE